MAKITFILIASAFLLAACGGDDDSGAAVAEPTNSGAASPSATVPSGSESNGGDVVDLQPPGQARAAVDGQEYVFNTLGPVGCDISEGEFNVGFLIGNNEASFIAGGTASGSEWRGRIDLNIQTSNGITNYVADFSGGGGGAIAVDGSSMSYSGPWVKLVSGGEDEPVGDGTLSVTCS